MGMGAERGYNRDQARGYAQTVDCEADRAYVNQDGAANAKVFHDTYQARAGSQTLGAAPAKFSYSVTDTQQEAMGRLHNILARLCELAGKALGEQPDMGGLKDAQITRHPSYSGALGEVERGTYMIHEIIDRIEPVVSRLESIA